MYQNPWTYHNCPYLGEDVDDFEGFVYLITDTTTGKLYIGKKFFWSTRKVKGASRRSTKESDWRSYYSSNDYIKSTAKKDPLRFKREILHLCKSKGEVNFLEIEEQFKREVLRSENYYNDSIQGKFYKHNVMKYQSSRLPDQETATRLL